MAGADDKAPDWSEEAKNWLHRKLGRKRFLALSLVLAVLGGGFYVWNSLLDRPGLAALIELVSRKPIPQADPQRFSVMVARIGGDAGDVLGNQIFEVLRDFQGVQTLLLDRTLGGSDRIGEEEQQEGEAAARDYVARSGASVLIWGRMIDADKHIARLFLTSTSREKGQLGRQVASEIGNTVSLPIVFWEDLAKVLRLAVAARAAAFEPGHFVADRLPPFITAVHRLIEKSDGRPGWSADVRGEVFVWLGIAQSTLGEQTGRDEPLLQAAESYRAALAEYTRERVPLDWAMTQNNLGSALLRLGERERGTARLEEAVAAYRAALAEYTRERVPLYWAMTQNNLGLALWRLGERESGTARLEEAVAAYRAALAERTREQVPLDWAGTQNNLGLALATLGERESGTARLEEAVAAYRAALQERTCERVPLYWATAQENLGIALKALGQRQGSADMLRDAVNAYEQALSVYSPHDSPYYFDKATRGLAEAKALLAERPQATVEGGH